MTDSKEWVTTKVPKDDRDTAKDLKPEDATYGDCLVAGAERLNDTDFAGPGPREGVVINPDAEELFDVDADIDPDAIARAVSQQIDYAHIADSVADELEGRMR